MLNLIVKFSKTFLYCFVASYTVLYFDVQQFSYAVLIALISAVLVAFDVIGHRINIRK